MTIIHWSWYTSPCIHKAYMSFHFGSTGQAAAAALNAKCEANVMIDRTIIKRQSCHQCNTSVSHLSFIANLHVACLVMHPNIMTTTPFIGWFGLRSKIQRLAGARQRFARKLSCLTSSSWLSCSLAHPSSFVSVLPDLHCRPAPRPP